MLTVVDCTDLPDTQDEGGTSDGDGRALAAAGQESGSGNDDRLAALENELAMGKAEKILAEVFQDDSDGLLKALASIEDSPDKVKAATNLRDLMKYKAEKSVVLADASQGRISPTGDDGSDKEAKKVNAAYEVLLADQTGTKIKRDA